MEHHVGIDASLQLSSLCTSVRKWRASQFARASLCRASASWVASSSSGPREPARPILACSVLRRDVAPLARRASVLARPSH